MLPLTSRVTGIDAAQTEPTAGKAVAGPARRPPERFMVTYQGCAPAWAGREGARATWSRHNGAGAISPDGRWAVFSQSSRTRRRASVMAGS